MCGNYFEQQCIACGNILSTVGELETGHCSECGHHINDFIEEDGDEDEFFPEDYHQS